MSEELRTIITLWVVLIGKETMMPELAKFKIVDKVKEHVKEFFGHLNPRIVDVNTDQGIAEVEVDRVPYPYSVFVRRSG